MEVRVKVWIEDENKNLIFGSGKTEILEYIEQTGSISKAAKLLDMNYKKAWSHIKILEELIEDDIERLVDLRIIEKNGDLVHLISKKHVL
mgnify:CR=1 FL=1